MQAYLSIALQFAFSLFVCCSIVFLISGAYLFFFKIDKANTLFRHPYLSQQAYRKYPLGIRMAIVMDYFFRLSFPNSKFWLVGNANRLLAHVDNEHIPTNIRWPIMGLWGSCLIGLVAMMMLWILLMLGTKP